MQHLSGLVVLNTSNPKQIELKCNISSQEVPQIMAHNNI